MIYLDYSATTPVDKRVLEVMKKYFDKEFGNPSSLHKLGQNALKAIDESRMKIKELISADYFREIIFTSSATESNNLAIKGLVFYFYFRLKIKPHIISSTIEHPSILEVLRDLKKLNLIDYDLVKPEKTGLVDPNLIKKFIKENTILVTIHYVNSEIGTIQKIKEISDIIHEINKDRDIKIIFHTDAAQAPLTEDISVKKLGVDMMTLSSHKIYGPKGIACLYKKENTILERLISGSEQEFGLRPSTENVPLIVGFAKALEIALNERVKTKKYFEELRDYFIKRLKEEKINFEINGDLKFSSPKILNLYFPQKTAQELLIYLDEKNIMVSAGMACKARANQPSYIIEEIYPNSERSKKSIRFSFGRETKKEDLDYVVKVLKEFFMKK
ncbi:MAG: cysteine desulfurase family protein [Nitrososphaerota archaeon]